MSGRLVNEYADVVEYLRVFRHVGFFVPCRKTMMDTSVPTIAQQVACLASEFHEQQTGHAPKSVTVVLSKDMLVITLHEALSPAERNLAKNPAGAAKVQEFHRQLFHTSTNSLNRKLSKITGREVHEAAAEIDPGTGSVVHAFTTGNVVQVFLLADKALVETASESETSH